MECAGTPPLAVGAPPFFIPIPPITHLPPIMKLARLGEFKVLTLRATDPAAALSSGDTPELAD